MHGAAHWAAFNTWHVGGTVIVPSNARRLDPGAIWSTIERERAILRARVPDLDEILAHRIAEVVASIRSMPLRKPPSVSETIDWARTLFALGIESVDTEALDGTLNVLLKYQADIDKVSKELAVEP